MAIANRYRGKDLVIQWIYSGGTVTLNGDYTKFDVERSIDLIDATAGNSLDKEYINGVKDGTAKVTFADTGTSGSAVAAAVVEGTAGSLIYGSQGTATGKPKGGFVAIVKSHKFSEPYDDMVTLEIEFQKNGAMLFDYGSSF